MGICPNCGSYVSPGTNVCSCGTTFGYVREVEEKKEPTEFQRIQEEKRKVLQGYHKKAKMMMDEGKYLEAIKYYDLMIEISESGYYIKAKAEAYYWAGMYDEALSFFKQSLNHFSGIDTFVILEWIGDTLNMLDRFDDAVGTYEMAIDVINKDYERKIKFHKEERWDSPSEAYFKSLLDEKNSRISGLQDRIDYSIELKEKAIRKDSPIPSEDDFSKQDEFLRSIGKENLVTIAGTFFYGNQKFETGMKFELVKEPDNEYDPDAIAVYLDGVKVGYVANNVRTVCFLTSKASDIKIPSVVDAEYVLHYGYRYHIAQIIR